MNNMLVYILSHPVTGEVRYIGKSESGLRRPRQHGHLSHLKKRSRLPVARWVAKLRSQGLDYAIEVVEECANRESLMEAERFYIAYFRSLGVRLLNICDGGEGFTGRHTPEAKARIGTAHRGIKKPGTAAALRGRKIDREIVERSAAARRGKSLSEAHCQALRVPKKKIFWKGKKHALESILKMARSKGARPFVDETGKIFQTQGEAARHHGIAQGSVYSVLAGKSRQADGHVFTYSDAILSS